MCGKLNGNLLLVETRDLPEHLLPFADDREALSTLIDGEGAIAWISGQLLTATGIKARTPDGRWLVSVVRRRPKPLPPSPPHPLVI